MVDGEDLAFLLANWTGSGQPVMAMPSPSGDEMGSALLAESEAPSAASFSDVPWIIAHFGFNSLEDYLT